MFQCSIFVSGVHRPIRKLDLAGVRFFQNLHFLERRHANREVLYSHPAYRLILRGLFGMG